MEALSFSEQLQRLADALANWTDLVLGNPLTSDASSEFDATVGLERLEILARLGAERRDLLASLIDTELARVLERGVKFVSTCRSSKLDVSLSRHMPLYHDPSSKPLPSSLKTAAASFIEGLWYCDCAFSAIDRALRQAEPSIAGKGAPYQVKNPPIESVEQKIKDALKLANEI